MFQNLSDVVSVPANNALPDDDPYFKKPNKGGGRDYLWFNCIECGKEQQARKGKSIDLGISRKCNKCIRMSRMEHIERDSKRMATGSCPDCGMKKQARRIKPKEGRSWCTGCKDLEKSKAKQCLAATVSCQQEAKTINELMRDSIADRQEMIYRSPAKRQKREEIEEASEVCSTVASTIDSSRSVMPMPSSMTVSRPNLNY